MSKKVVAAKSAKKAPQAPKPAKEAKPGKESKSSKKPASVQLVSFAVQAVIPTQQYGNIQPRIEVSASSIEEARAFVMPIIEDLYGTYAEEPLNGKTPKFLGKITEEVRHVAPKAPEAAPAAPKAEEPAPSSDSSVAAPEAAPESSDTQMPEGEKPAPVVKAEKAIALAATADAAVAIQDQIEKSVKIPADWKPFLITLVLKRRNELK